MKTWSPWVLLCALLLTTVSCRLLPQEERVEKTVSPAAVSTPPSIVFEEPQVPVVESPGVEEERASQDDAILPRIAIIIDDMGYHGSIGQELLALDLNLTFSFLPGAPFTKNQEEEAWVKGRTIMLHLPMQAQSKRWNPGPGALYISYAPQRIRSVILEDLESVPHAVGCNNHMGSGFTEDRAGMHAVLAVLKEQHLFFVDSYTTARSTGLDEARRMQVPTARRHVFLDNVQNVEKICRQLDTLLTLAEEKGEAIGIAHPHRATLQALRKCGQRITGRAELVGADQLVR